MTTPFVQDRAIVARLEAEFETRTIPVTVADPNQHDAPLIYANRAFEELTGYDRGRIVGQNCRFLQKGMPDQPDRKKLRDAVAAQTPVDVLLTNVQSDGTLFQNYLIVEPITLRGGPNLLMGCQFRFDFDTRLVEFVAHMERVDRSIHRAMDIAERRKLVAIETHVTRTKSLLAVLKSRGLISL